MSPSQEPLFEHTPRKRRIRGPLQELPEEAGQVRVEKTLEARLARRLTPRQFVIVRRYFAKIEPYGWDSGWGHPNRVEIPYAEIRQFAGCAERTVARELAELIAIRLFLPDAAENQTHRGPFTLDVAAFTATPLTEVKRRRDEHRAITRRHARSPAAAPADFEVTTGEAELHAPEFRAAYAMESGASTRDSAKCDVTSRPTVEPLLDASPVSYAAESASAKPQTEPAPPPRVPEPSTIVQIETMNKSGIINRRHGPNVGPDMTGDSAVSCPFGLPCPHKKKDLPVPSQETQAQANIVSQSVWAQQSEAEGERPTDLPPESAQDIGSPLAGRMEQIRAAIPGELRHKLQEQPSQFLLRTIEEILPKGCPLGNFTDRIILRWKAINSLGLLIGLAQDVAKEWNADEAKQKEAEARQSRASQALEEQLLDSEDRYRQWVESQIDAKVATLLPDALEAALRREELALQSDPRYRWRYMTAEGRRNAKIDALRESIRKNLDLLGFEDWARIFG